MSSGDPSGSGYASPAGSSSSNRRVSGRPNYMTVGNGSTSESAARLQAMLDQDSGYGGSVADDASMNRGWNPGMTDDVFMPSPQPGEVSGQCKRELMTNLSTMFSNTDQVQLTMTRKLLLAMSISYSTTKTAPLSPAQFSRRSRRSRSCRK